MKIWQNKTSTNNNLCFFSTVPLALTGRGHLAHGSFHDMEDVGVKFKANARGGKLFILYIFKLTMNIKVNPVIRSQLKSFRI